jgi:transposase
MKTCIFCHSPKLYVKSPTQYYCVTCKKVWSTLKHERDGYILDAFLANESAFMCAQKHDLAYNTVKEVYQKLRLILSTYAQEIYAKQTEAFSQYDEYYYLPNTKRHSKKYFFDAIGIFGMLYKDNWIYTLLLPDQFSGMKRLMAHDEIEAMEHEAYARFLQRHKVARVSHFEHRLGEFWSYFELFMHHFKGVKKENLIYYLKEAEFKFNHSKEKQKEIMLKLWREAM